MKSLVSICASSCDGYASSKDRKDLPLGWYALTTLAYVGLATLVVREAARKKLKLSTQDLILYGAAVHKFSRLATKASVTSAFRAPLTRYECSLGYGEFQEVSRRDGFLGDLGDLVSCNYCADAWIALAGLFGLTQAPSTIRVAMQGLSVIAFADFLHVLYETIRTQENVLSLEEDNQIKKKVA
jgi:hypothetical protein